MRRPMATLLLIDDEEQVRIFFQSRSKGRGIVS